MFGAMPFHDCELAVTNRLGNVTSRAGGRTRYHAGPAWLAVPFPRDRGRADLFEPLVKIPGN